MISKVPRLYVQGTRKPVAWRPEPGGEASALLPWLCFSPSLSLVWMNWERERKREKGGGEDFMCFKYSKVHLGNVCHSLPHPGFQSVCELSEKSELNWYTNEENVLDHFIFLMDMDKALLSLIPRTCHRAQTFYDKCASNISKHRPPNYYSKHQV